MKQEDARCAQSIQMIFVLHLEKTLYGKFFNGVRVAHTTLYPLEKRKQQLGLYGRGFQPVGHGPVVGHSSFFSGPWSINENESNMYNIYV